MLTNISFLSLGFITGFLGTLIGAGGGFLLAPIFLFLFPDMLPSRLTALSLLAVAANSISGSIAYTLRKQVHWPSVFLFSILAIPGAYLGLLITQSIPRTAFEFTFSGFLFCLGFFVVWRSLHVNRKSLSIHEIWNKKTKILGSAFSFFIGIISSLLGIGGGIVHVPLLSELLGYPVHLAAGTSHAILAITATFAVIGHFYHGDLLNLDAFVPFLVIGLVVGAQFGAAISKKVHSRLILRALGVVLLLVAFRLLYKNLA